MEAQQVWVTRVEALQIRAPTAQAMVAVAAAVAVTNNTYALKLIMISPIGPKLAMT
jgi:hypothetical protein